MAAEIKTDLDPRALMSSALKGLAMGVLVMGVVLFFTISPDTVNQLKCFPMGLLPILALLVCASWFCSGARLCILGRALGYRITLFQGLVAGLAAEFGIGATPGGVGGTVIRLVFLNRGGMPLTVGASLLTADAFLDIFFFIGLMPFALILMAHDSFWNPVTDELRKVPLGAVCSLVIFLAVVLVILIRKGGGMTRWLENKLEYIEMARERRLATRLRFARRKTKSALALITKTTTTIFQRHFLAIASVLVLAAIQWLCRYGILPVMLLVFSGKESFLPLVAIQGILLALSLMIILPGGGGSVELITTLVLKQFMPLSAVGFVLIIWRFFTYHLYLLVGGVAFFFTWKHMDRVFPRLHHSGNSGN